MQALFSSMGLAPAPLPGATSCRSWPTRLSAGSMPLTALALVQPLVPLSGSRCTPVLNMVVSVCAGLTSRPLVTPHAQCQDPGNPYRLQFQADLVLKLCQLWSCEQVVLVGHSDGALVAVRAAAEASRYLRIWQEIINHFISQCKGCRLQQDHYLQSNRIASSCESIS